MLCSPVEGREGGGGGPVCPCPGGLENALWGGGGGAQTPAEGGGWRNGLLCRALCFV